MILKIIIAADADAEGEAIGRDMIFRINPNIDIPIYRLWNTGSFKSKEAVEKSMRDIMPYDSEVYENLYDSQKARSNADFIAGMKVTKVLVDHYNKKFYVGRVKSVVVSLIGDRINEIKDFVPKKYYQISGKKEDLELSHFYYKDVEDFDDSGELKITKQKTKNYNTYITPKTAPIQQTSPQFLPILFRRCYL